LKKTASNGKTKSLRLQILQMKEMIPKTRQVGRYLAAVIRHISTLFSLNYSKMKQLEILILSARINHG